jgi:hypothetical protein
VFSLSKGTLASRKTSSLALTAALSIHSSLPVYCDPIFDSSPSAFSRHISKRRRSLGGHQFIFLRRTLIMVFASCTGAVRTCMDVGMHFRMPPSREGFLSGRYGSRLADASRWYDIGRSCTLRLQGCSPASYMLCNEHNNQKHERL